MERPSKVEVPRPISSRMTRLRAVALLGMLAVSFISTMKVDWPLERSSFAPTRVKMRSVESDLRAGGGEVTAHLREEDEERGLADVGGFAGHVRAGDDEELLPSPSSWMSLGTNLSRRAVCWSRTGWRPSRDVQLAGVVEHRAAVVDLAGGFGQRGEDVRARRWRTAVSWMRGELERARERRCLKELDFARVGDVRPRRGSCPRSPSVPE